MFVDPGASLLRMAFKTSLVFDSGARSSEAGPFTAPVGGMAVRAFHCALEHLVRVGEIERRFHVLVAGKAEVDLIRLQVFRAHGGPVDLMAVITSNGTELMNRSSELRKVLLFLMAFQADIRIGLGIVPLKGEDEPFSLCIRMFRTRTMAGFTSFFARRNLFVHHILPVRVAFVEGAVDIGMALFTGLGSDIFGRPSLLILAVGTKTNEGYDYHQGDKCYRRNPAPIHNVLLH